MLRKALVGMTVAVFALSVALTNPFTAAHASGGGGGGSKKATYRVTGFITAIDPENHLVTFGTSYYNTGVVWISDDTKIIRNGQSAGFDSIQLGDYGQADIYFSTREAVKVELGGAS